MKKIIVFLMPFIAYSNSETKVNKIIYNNQEDSLAIFFNSNIKENSKFDIAEIDTLVDNFKFAKNNDINVNIEPTEESGKVNLVVKNTKSNPLSLSFSFDNQGSEENKYRYTFDVGTSGLFLSENIKLSYTFTPEIEPDRTIEENKFQEARRNNNLMFQLNFPFKSFQTYFTYSYSDYKRSILGNNDIYDVSGNSNRYDLNIKTLFYRNKKHKLKIITGYSHILRNSYLEDVLIEKENQNHLKLGFEYELGENKIESIYTYKIEENKSMLDSSIKLKKKDVVMNINNHLEKDRNKADVVVDLDLKKVYLALGFHTDFRKANPILRLGYKQDIWKINIDTSLNYETEFKWLFNIKFNVF